MSLVTLARAWISLVLGLTVLPQSLAALRCSLALDGQVPPAGMPWTLTSSRGLGTAYIGTPPEMRRGDLCERLLEDSDLGMIYALATLFMMIASVNVRLCASSYFACTAIEATAAKSTAQQAHTVDLPSSPILSLGGTVCCHLGGSRLTSLHLFALWAHMEADDHVNGRFYLYVTLLGRVLITMGLQRQLKPCPFIEVCVKGCRGTFATSLTTCQGAPTGSSVLRGTLRALRPRPPLPAVPLSRPTVDLPTCPKS